jgi:hypothetical protein
VTDPNIVLRLLDTSRPAGFRVLVSSDPVTSEKVPGGGKHVGKTVYVNDPSYSDSVRLPDLAAHEPANLRQYMIDSIADPRTPPTAWRYRKLTDLSPDRNAADKASVTELSRLAEAAKNYYSDNDQWFDAAAFDRDVALRFAIYRDD